MLTHLIITRSLVRWMGGMGHTAWVPPTRSRGPEGSPVYIYISIVDISTLLKNIGIDIDIDMVIFENIDFD